MIKCYKCIHKSVCIDDANYKYAENCNRYVKEEPETVKQIDNFGKVANGIAMKLARNIANER